MLAEIEWGKQENPEKPEQRLVPPPRYEFGTVMLVIHRCRECWEDRNFQSVKMSQIWTH